MINHKFVIRIFGCLLLLFLMSEFVYAQRQTIAPQQLREADIQFSKRVWRVIDLNERINKTATWPKNPLSKILYDAALAGKLRPYKDDSLRQFYDVEKFVRLGSDTVLVRKLLNPQADDENYRIDTVLDAFNPTQKIKQLLLLEEWYFDKKQGMQRVQIIAIAPLYKKVVSGYDLGYLPLCWFKYYDRTNIENDCRDVLVNQAMYNAGNPYQKFSYDDWFEQRLFGSFVIKESNPYDIFLMDDPEVKRNGIEALIEAGKRQHLMMMQDHDEYEY